MNNERADLYMLEKIEQHIAVGGKLDSVDAANLLDIAKSLREKLTAPPSEGEIEAVGNAIKAAYDAIDSYEQLSEFDKINAAKAAITKWIEMRS